MIEISKTAILKATLAEIASNPDFEWHPAKNIRWEPFRGFGPVPPPNQIGDILVPSKMNELPGRDQKVHKPLMDLDLHRDIARTAPNKLGIMRLVKRRGFLRTLPPGFSFKNMADNLNSTEDEPIPQLDRGVRKQLPTLCNLQSDLAALFWFVTLRDLAIDKAKKKIDPFIVLQSNGLSSVLMAVASIEDQRFHIRPFGSGDKIEGDIKLPRVELDRYGQHGPVDLYEAVDAALVRHLTGRLISGAETRLDRVTNSVSFKPNSLIDAALWSLLREVVLDLKVANCDGCGTRFVKSRASHTYHSVNCQQNMKKRGQR